MPARVGYPAQAQIAGQAFVRSVSSVTTGTPRSGNRSIYVAVIANNDEMVIGAIQALKAAGVGMDTVVITGIDATADALAAMQADDLDVTVFQNAAAQVKGAVEAAIKLINGEPVDQKVWVPFELVTPENMQTYIDRN